MFEKIQSLSFSAYCSLILSSAFLAAAPQTYQSAAMALPDAAIQVVRRAGWNVPEDATAAAVPVAATRIVAVSQSADEGILSKAADYTFKNGADINLSGKLCTPLGVTQNKADFPVRQYVVETETNKQTLNVSRVRGRVDIIIFYRTANEGTLYLTSVDGDLEGAIHATKTGVEVLNLAAAKADFEREKAWWLGQVGNSTVASSQP